MDERQASGPARLGRRLAGLLIRRRLAVIAVWTLLFAALLPAAAALQDHLSPVSRIEGAPSTEVEAILAADFVVDLSRSAWLIVTGLPDLSRPPGRKILRRITADLEALPEIAAARSALDLPLPFLVGTQGTGAVFLVSLDRAAAARQIEDALRAQAEILRAELAAPHPEVRLYWTGNFFFERDVLRLSAADVQEGELRALPLTLLLLLWAFGALVAALCPIVLGVLTIVLALGLAGLATLLLAGAWAPSVLLQSVATLMGLALGIDYALLTTSRFREALAAGLTAEAAALESCRRAGPTVLLSGSSVAVGFAALFVVPIGELRSVAVGGLLASAFAVLTATTLLPAILVLLGRNIDRGRLGFLPKRGAAPDRWLRWGRLVCRRPWLFLLGIGLPLLLLAMPVKDLRIALPSDGWLPPEVESVQGIAALERIGRGSLLKALWLLYEPAEGRSLRDPAVGPAIQRLYRDLRGRPEIAEVIALPRWIPETVPLETALDRLPVELRQTFVGASEQVTAFQVLPAEDLSTEGLLALVGELRALDLAAATGGLGGRLLVGGTPAATLDYQTVIIDWLPALIGLVLAGSFLTLLIAFRAVLIPLKAVILNLLSLAATFGLLTLVFIDGYGLSWLGLAAPVDGVFPAIPVIVFCTVFGISMDYEVFLVARIDECREGAASEAEAIAQGLAHTGAVITNAAGVMVVVFSAFAFGGFLPVKMLGFALAAAVLIDATLVRVALGPALMSIAGRWNWWPGRQTR